MTRPAAVPTARLVVSVAAVSAAVLGFEIALLRLLLMVSWHHFAFLVISMALLGFGASGTLLTLTRRTALRGGEGAMLWLVILTAATMVIATSVALRLPLEARLVPAVAGRQLAAWACFWALLTLPFLTGAAAVGLGIMLAPTRVGAVYGANLLGSGAGAALMPLLMLVVLPAWLPVLTASVALAAALPLRPWSRRARATLLIGTTAVLAISVIVAPPRLRVDPFKDVAFMRQLEAQELVVAVARRDGPRSVIEAFTGDVLHDLPFLGLDAAPPPITALLIDGHGAGSLCDVDTLEAAAVLDATLPATFYPLVPRSPRVALLGEVGGANVWPALRAGARSVHVVQPDGRIGAMLAGPLRDAGGAVMARPAVTTVVAEPRHFVEHADASFDLLQLVTLESTASGPGGFGGLGQDELMTVEGVGACLDRLTDEGVLMVCRAIQTPPRDNLRIVATAAAALRARGVEQPGRHVAVLRDYLGVCTLVRPTAWTEADVARIRDLCRARQLTPVWFTGIEADELNRPDALPAAPDGVGDWYHYAVVRLLSPEADDFVDRWVFDIRPPTDDRPFFHDFCRLRSIGAMREAFGDLWLTRVELALLFVVAAIVVIAVVGATLTVLPLLLGARAVPPPGRMATVGYFAAIGLAYMLLEMTVLASMTRMIGDAVVATALTIAGFLVCSGVGSLAAQRLSERGTGVTVPRLLLALVVAAAAVTLVVIAMTAIPLGAAGPVLRCILALLIVTPAATLMGFPMPLALSRLHRGTAALIPWAWGINGFASVLAPPLAMLLAMLHGYAVVGAAAVLLYGLALVLFARVPGAAGAGTSPSRSAEP